VAVCFFGEGALGQGSLYEVMNLAQLWKLPVIYVCENNLYNEYTHFSETTAGTILGRAAAFGLESALVDGQDVRAVNEVATRLVKRARAGEGPAFLQADTYRYSGHHVGDINREYYRSKQEEQHWKTERDPIKLHANWLLTQGHADAAALEHITAEARARDGSRGEIRHRRAVSQRRPGGAGCLCLMPFMSERELTFAQAVREALAEEMRRDSRVCIFGEDVAEAGTPFKVLSGLVEEFGAERVVDTPISEAGFTGVGVGAAMTGLRPVVDIMFGDFLTLTMDQMVNQAAKAHYMSGGHWRVPMVMRTTLGATRRSAAQHSQSLHAWFSHVPGLKVVLPSHPTMRKAC
jgi:2-oxoisovalerate dehydrogenase E1 component